MRIRGYDRQARPLGQLPKDHRSLRRLAREMRRRAVLRRVREGRAAR